MTHSCATWLIRMCHDAFICDTSGSAAAHTPQATSMTPHWLRHVTLCYQQQIQPQLHCLSGLYTHKHTHFWPHKHTLSLLHRHTHSLLHKHTWTRSHTSTHTHSLSHTQTHILYHTHTHVIGRKYFPNKGNVFLKGIFLKKENIFLQLLKVWLGIARTSADSQLNPVYKAFHRICCWGNKTIRR